MAQGVNDMVAGHVDLMNETMACVAEFGRGNFEAPLKQFPGKKASINETIERLRGNIQNFVAEMHRMADAHDRGDIDVVIPVDRFEGAYRTMAQGVNDMVAGHLALMNETMACMAEFGRGNFEAPLKQFPGKKASINETIERLRGNIQNFVAEMHRMADAHDRGDIDVVIPTARFEGAYQTMAQGVNNMVAGHLALMNETMACMAEFGKGNFEAQLEKFPGKKASINETIERLRGNIRSFVAEMRCMADEHIRGDIDVVIRADKFEGAYRTMAQGVNDMVGGHLALMNETMACVAEFGRGNFEAPLEKFPGKKAFINDTVERVRGNLKYVAAEGIALADAAVKGQLDARADEGKYTGAWRQIIQGMNKTLEGFAAPMRDIGEVLDRLAAMDFSHGVERDYPAPMAGFATT